MILVYGVLKFLLTHKHLLLLLAKQDKGVKEPCLFPSRKLVTLLLSQTGCGSGAAGRRRRG